MSLWPSARHNHRSYCGVLVWCSQLCSLICLYYSDTLLTLIAFALIITLQDQTTKFPLHFAYT